MDESILKQRPSETYDDYFVRLFENKKEYKPFDNIFKAKVKSDTSQKFNILERK